MITNYTGVSGSRTSYLISRQLTETSKALVVVSNGRAAARLAEDLAFFLPAAEIIVMPESEDIQILYEARDRSSQIQRMKGIQALCGSGPGSGAGKQTAGAVVIAPVSAVVKPTVSPARYRSAILQVSLGEQLEPADFRELLVAGGYNHAAVTESPGEFTSRGGIVDVFPPSFNNPVRIEFFGDEIDSIRYYDPDTQRSLENATAITIGPAAEFIPTSEEKRAALARIQREYDRRIKSAKSQYAEEHR